MFRAVVLYVVTGIMLFAGIVPAQTILEYTVKRAVSPLEIDGRLDEADWEAAALTERFVFYVDGTAVVLNTRGKMLWDDQYLYVAFICEDPDVWGTYVNRDDALYNQEVVEFFIDPDGDSLDYIELEFSPKATILDYLMSKPWSDGGKANAGWTYDGMQVAVWVDGTLNNQDDTDVKWVCECALPFDEIAFIAPTMNFPPQPGDSWRVNLYRYDYGGADRDDTELSGWNQTDKRGFHAPDKFGTAIFSSEPAIGPTSAGGTEPPGAFGINGNYPNPFNPSTTIEFILPDAGAARLEIYDIIGRRVTTLLAGERPAGVHSLVWNGRDANGLRVTSGVYIARLGAGGHTVNRRMLLMK